MARRVVDRFESMQTFADSLGDYLTQTSNMSDSSIQIRVSDETTDPRTSQETQAISHDRVATLKDQILNPGTEALADLGFDDQLKSEIQDLVSRGTGVLLACGPEKSGTTTTVGAMLRSIDTYRYTFYSFAEPEKYDLP